jgi:predicted DNA binding protein
MSRRALETLAPPTFHQHLHKAEQKVLEKVVSLSR